MGMDGHEWPYLVKNNMFGWEKALTLQPHMTFSDEPGVYIRGEFGVRLEAAIGFFFFFAFGSFLCSASR